MAAAEQTVAATATESGQKKQPGGNPRFDHPFTTLCTFKVPIVIQQKGGNVVKGRAKWFRKGFLKLTNAEVVGLNRQVKADWILVDHQTIAHVHPDPDAEQSSPEQP